MVELLAYTERVGGSSPLLFNILKTNKKVSIDIGAGARVRVLSLKYRGKLNLIYLSISPNTISWVPIIVTISAIKCPFDIKGNPCKCTKPGAFMWQRYG